MKYETIALATDFSGKSPFAGIMKGVIRRKNPKAAIVDLNNGIAPGDIRSAAFELLIASGYFSRTVFICVVDPGVATDRDILLAADSSNAYLAPDNGALSLLLAKNAKMKIFKVRRSAFSAGKKTTFDGRDIFAPAAAHLAAGRTSGFTPWEKEKIKKIEWPQPVRRSNGIVCEIVYIDSFGNCWTNFRYGVRKIKSASSGRIKLNKFSSSYSGRGDTMLFNSFGFLEFASCGGSFEKKHRVSRGKKFTLKIHE